jgi:hypothetical protein
MEYDVLEARYLGGHRVWVRFRDGSAGEVDLSPVIWGPMFEPLKDPAYFRTFTVHPSSRPSSGPTAPTSPRSTCTLP